MRKKKRILSVVRVECGGCKVMVWISTIPHHCHNKTQKTDSRDPTYFWELSWELCVL